MKRARKSPPLVSSEVDVRKPDASGKTAVVGMPLSGKTVLARALRQCAAVCPACGGGAEIVELDEEVERREGMSIPDLFAVRGESYFRQQEAALLEEYARADHPVVIFVGGGAVTWPDSKAALLRYGRIIFLRAQLSTLKGRMSSDECSKRPLLREHPERIEELFEQRNPLFYELATDVIDVDSRSVDELAEEFTERFLSQKFRNGTAAAQRAENKEERITVSRHRDYERQQGNKRTAIADKR